MKHGIVNGFDVIRHKFDSMLMGYLISDISEDYQSTLDAWLNCYRHVKDSQRARMIEKLRKQLKGEWDNP